MITRQDVIEAIETLDGLQPSWYREILENGPQGDEKYTLSGDDLGSVIHAISVLKEYFNLEEVEGGFLEERRSVANKQRTVIE